MAKRWAWGAGLAVVAALLVAGGWRATREIPKILAKAGDALREEGARRGLTVAYRSIDIRLLPIRVSVEGLAVDDAVGGGRVLECESIDVFPSLRRLLARELPVSMIRAHRFVLRVREENLPVIDRLATPERGSGETALPELLFVEGRIEAGPLGPLGHLAVKVPEIRVRTTRFLGTRVTAALKGASGTVDLPVAGPGRLPFDAAEADVIVKEGTVRIGKLKVSGPAGTLKASGQVDARKKAFDIETSASLDIAAWAGSGAPGAEILPRYSRAGRVDLTAEGRGTLDAPGGTARVSLRDVDLAGLTTVSATAAASLTGRRIAIRSLEGRLFDGHLAGEGWHDLGTGETDARVTLAEVALGDSPWRQLGFPWRPAGTGRLEASFSGRAVQGVAEVAWSHSNGFEPVSKPGGAAPAAVRIPFSARASLETGRDGVLVVPRFTAMAGPGTLTGRGRYDPSGPVLAVSGDLRVPSGRAADYGSAWPLSWHRIAASWKATGEGGRLAVTLDADADGIGWRSLPRVPAAIRIEGDPAGFVHFVADLPTEAGTVTASGTALGPLAGKGLRLDGSLAVREIDFARCAAWAPAFLAEFGTAPAGFPDFVSDVSGEGSADLQVALAGDDIEVSGSLNVPGIRKGPLEAESVIASGRWVRKGGLNGWEGRASGRLADGLFALRGEGGDGAAEASGSVENVDLARVAAAFPSRVPAGTSGRLAAEVLFRGRRSGWEVPRVTVSSPSLKAFGVDVGGLSAEGAMGLSAGRLAVRTEKPGVRAAVDVLRTEGWPASFSVRLDNVATADLLAAAGRAEGQAGGHWSAEAEGSLRLADLAAGKPPRAFLSALLFKATGNAPHVSGAGFGEVRAEGARQGDLLAGTVRTRSPDSDLAFTLGLREPFSFALRGPFAVGPREPDAGGGEGGRPPASALTLAGKVDVAGALEALEGTRGRLEVRELAYRSGGIDLLGSDIALDMGPGGVRWAGGAIRATGNPLTISGHASWGGDLDVRVTGRVPLAALRTVTDIFDRLEGAGQVDLRVKGPVSAPGVVGTGQAEGATLSFRNYDQVFEKMNAQVVISQEKIVFETFDGRSGGGFIDGSGELPLRFGPTDTMHFSVEFTDMKYPYPGDMRPVLQGHVELSGPVDNLLISGDVEVLSARYVKKISPEALILDFRKRLADVRARREKSDFRIRLDINVVADGTIRVDNNLGEIDARGEFRVAGDTGNVVILGSFDVIEGYVEYLDSRYEIKQLTLEFQDPRRNNPHIEARAETRKNDVLLTVSVDGTLDKYEIEVASEPPLTRNEIVNLLAFGVTTPTTASSDQTMGIGGAAALALTPATGRVEEGVKGVVGIDKFTIEPVYSSERGTFEPKFTVGKTFGDRLKVSVSTNVGETTETGATAEVKLGEQVYLEGAYESQTPTSGGAVGGDLKFKYRYKGFKDLFRGRD